MREQNRGRDAEAIDELLSELAELRELDRRRKAHRPGSAAYDAATLEVDLRSRRVMDRFRDLKARRERDYAHDRRDYAPDLRVTRRIDDARHMSLRNPPGTDELAGNRRQGNLHLN